MTERASAESGEWRTLFLSLCAKCEINVFERPKVIQIRKDGEC